MENQNNASQQYQYQPQPQPQKEKGNGLSIASLVCGLVSFFGCCNPLYLVSATAVILGIVALCVNRSKGMAITGIILGVVGAGIWIILDAILSVFTMGLSFFI
ncbi:MAG: DUF4190 domain-containing protein [Clostridia bacterium]|nr:DUF4190 domain-containing protein [Clostridia bacterium]